MSINTKLPKVRQESIRKLVGESWYVRLKEYFESETFVLTIDQIMRENVQGITIYPEFENVFRAFRETPYEDVKILILGQDPYHDGSADGLAFSNRPGTKKVSPSLKNILTEVVTSVRGELDFSSEDTDLTRWARQGVLLLNTSLTVRKGSPLSHATLWGALIEHVFSELDNTNGIIYLLWGKQAKEYRRFIDASRNHILEADHPASAAYNGGKTWFGNNHFVIANQLIEQMNGPQAKILW